jgi:hypothetical protein
MRTETSEHPTHIINDVGGRVHANKPAVAMRQTLAEFGGAKPGGGRDR